jgi:regulator of sigma E protease
MIILYILLAVLIFGMLIFIHELGHYAAARAFGVPVTEFAIGFGPKLLSHVSKKTGIKYSLRLVPFGGFVSMVGEDEESDNENAINRKPYWQRFIILVSGAFMNLLAGIVAMSILVMTSTTLPSSTIYEFADSAVTPQYGLEADDTIIKVGGTRVHIANDMVYEIMRKGTKPVDITVKRGNETVVLKDVVFPTITEQGILFGTVDFYVTSEVKTFGNVLKQSFWRSYSTVKMIWESLFDLVTGKYGLSQVSGPVGVTEAIGEAAQESLPDLVYLCAVISLNLGIVNLLPLPALDGGRVVFLAVDAIRRKPVDPKYEGYVHFVGIILLMALMVVVTFKDIVTLFK